MHKQRLVSTIRAVSVHSHNKYQYISTDNILYNCTLLLQGSTKLLNRQFREFTKKEKGEVGGWGGGVFGIWEKG